MTLTSDAKDVFAQHGIDRDHALVAAKALGQQIIDDSQSTDTPLNGIVYDVWGLYNDGMPECRFEVPSEDDDIVFACTFRAEEHDTFVERKRTLSTRDLKSLLKKAV